MPSANPLETKAQKRRVECIGEKTEISGSRFLSKHGRRRRFHLHPRGISLPPFGSQCGLCRQAGEEILPSPPRPWPFPKAEAVGNSTQL